MTVDYIHSIIPLLEHALCS